MSIWAATALLIESDDAGEVPAARKYMPGAPEIYLSKAIDNSRLVKVADLGRRREMRVFSVALSVLFLVLVVYVWQHFSAIEYGYKIEALRAQRDSLREANRSLKLEEASLRDPQRIDTLARGMGLQLPQAGQVQAMESSAANDGPIMARAAGTAPALSN